jgi:putative chitinase
MKSAFEALASNIVVARKYYEPLLAAMGRFNIINPQEQQMFLAQVAHESGGFNYVDENLNYSAAGLLKTFPRHFATPQQAQDYARNPMAIANRVYANRMGNGDEFTGDGWRYHGRGLIQLTGRDNYTAFARAILGEQWESLVREPGTVSADPHYAALSAAWFWASNKIGAISHDIELTTKRINGGLNGLEDRKQKLATARQNWSLA